MKSSMRKSCLRAYSRMARRWTAHVLLRGRDPQIGNGFHGLTMEYAGILSDRYEHGMRHVPRY